MKTYSKMKESGIEWIGKIPENWELRKVKNSELMKISSGEVTENYEEGEFSVYGANGKIGKSDLYNVENIVMIGRVGYYAGSVIQIPEKAWVTDNGLIVKTSSEIDNGFLFYAFSSLDFNRFAQITAQPLISQTLLSQFQFCLPSTKEQSNIANYLDKQTKIIDIKIEKNQKLIILLEKKKQSLIDQAITKGLVLSVPMKDSGIDWIGYIPEHWKIEPLNRNIKINEKTLSEKTKNDLKIQYIDIGKVSHGKIDSSEPMYFSNSPSRARRIVSVGDTIISTVRTYLKAIAFIDKTRDGHICSTEFAVLSPSTSLKAKFLYFLISSEKYVDTIMANSLGVVYPAINSNVLGKLPCILPPKNEQEEIEKFLDNETSKINVIMTNIELQIKKLKEFQKSLIKSLVTGKIDVREAIA